MPLRCFALQLVFFNLRGNVGGELHHFQLAGAVKHRIIGGAQPDGIALLIDALELAGDVFTLIELVPEAAIGLAGAHFGRTEQAVMATDDLISAIAHGIEEVIVGHQHFTFEVEGNHRHRALNGGGRVAPAHP